MGLTNISSAWISRSIRLIAAVAAVGLAGCAGMTETQCRGANWYDLGFEDGERFGLRPQIDQRAYQCQAFGIQASEAEYLRGWTDGYREWVGRVHASDCCPVQ